MSKASQLRALIQSDELEFIMEAHNGLSAKIVEEAGFKGIWGSGLCISAQYGVRDNNEASWTQVLDNLEFMSDATSIPILLDGDTGYGNFNNARRLVRKLEQIEVGGVCIEDKLFPKTNSFIGGEQQPLADTEEFCGKLKAMKDAQSDDDFVVVARVEAFIAGWGLSEALRRAELYRQAGADAILMHSKVSTSAEIDSFMAEWGDRHPVVIVPTKYYSTPTDHFRDIGVSLSIWANHNLRSCITTMQRTTETIFKDQSLHGVESKVASVAEVFRLQGATELKEAEKRYLPTAGKQYRSIVLAAGQGDLGELTQEIPKTLLKVIDGQSILQKQVDSYNRAGIRDVSVVRGFGKDKIALANLNYVDNDEHSTTREVYSLWLTQEQLEGNVIVSYGDILFKDHILNDLIQDNNDVVLVVEADYEYQNDTQDLVQAEQPYSRGLFGEDVAFKAMGPNLPKEQVDGEFIGLWKMSDRGAVAVREALSELSTQEGFKTMNLDGLFNHLKAKGISVAVKYIKGSWLDVDSMTDLQRAQDL